MLQFKQDKDPERDQIRFVRMHARFSLHAPDGESSGSRLAYVLLLFPPCAQVVMQHPRNQAPSSAHSITLVASFQLYITCVLKRLFCIERFALLA